MKQTLSLLLVILSLNVFALKPQKEYNVRPENYALIYKDLNIITDDGLKIKTWFFPAQDSIPKDEWYKAAKHPVKKEYKIKYDLPRPTIILCDGDAGNMTYQLPFAKELVGYGYNVVTFDWRGFGESDSWQTNEDLLVYPEYLLDYNAVINEVAKQNEVDKQRIGLFGFSTGAYLSFATFYKQPELKAFAGRGLLTDLKSAVGSIKQVIPDKKIIIPEDYPENLMPINIASKIDRPCFLVVGELDKRTPVSMSITIFNLLKGEKQLWVVNNATHGGATGPEFIDFKKFMTQLRTFYDLNL
jgi:pimeloyl-ACP methyl ester carboxylesterase